MSEIRITIDGRECIGQSGETVLTIAKRNGIDIPTLCFDERVKIYGACGVCLVEGEGMPKLMRSCATEARDGAVYHTDTERVKRARRIAFELLMSDHEGDCLGPCKLNCPAGTDCQAYLKQIAQGNDTEAVKIIKDHLPLPASIGRVCPHPCEKACRRQYVDEPISIAFLKYFAADNDLFSGNKFMPEIAPETGKKIGIIGGGPGGLTAAYFLRKKGHEVTVYDQMPYFGGMLRYGIPEYRLPKDGILQKEIDSIAEMGVKFVPNYKIGRDESLEDFRARHDATVVAIGAWTSSAMRCPGEDLKGVFGGIHFLREVIEGGRPAIGKRVAIVGGGNTAMDACRTAVRLGAEKVYVIYRRTEAEMPAEKIEIAEAREEGVEFKFLCNPAQIVGENGRVKEVKLQIMQLGEPDASGRRSPVPVEGAFETLQVDSVIAAIGQYVDAAGFEAIEKNRRGVIAADEHTFRTNLPDVFAVGDATNKGADIAIAAIGEAGKAADVIDSFLRGAEVPYVKPFVSERKPEDIDFTVWESYPRAQMPARPGEERRCDFAEVNKGFDEETARREAARCLECGCHDYKDCLLIRYAQREQVLDVKRLAGEKHPNYTEERLVVIERNQGKCVTCNLCVRVCDEEVGIGLLGLVGRGFTTVIKPEFNTPGATDVCRTCLKCAQACPTGALRILFDQNGVRIPVSAKKRA
ncbi:MAG: FAD-dependent oxidoreductase [Lachnospiraceae bacterium]|nr:FAD-dependent oxidoreductase [Lachnospiraceae bacterium]